MKILIFLIILCLCSGCQGLYSPEMTGALQGLSEGISDGLDDAYARDARFLRKQDKEIAQEIDRDTEIRWQMYPDGTYGPDFGKGWQMYPDGTYGPNTGRGWQMYPDGTYGPR